jgi:putative glycerol-1-phosphate prenyltransferase
MSILNQIKETPHAIAMLIDPEKAVNNLTVLKTLLDKAVISGIDFLFIGGSTVSREDFEKTVDFIHANSTLQTILFPGSSQQISNKADAMLYLSLLSGRNPDFLIGHHVDSAFELFAMEIELIPTAYILIEGGSVSSTEIVSQTEPIPRENFELVRRTAIAGKFMGKDLLYLDAGSGAKFPVLDEMLQNLSDIHLPIIVGGGIRTIEKIRQLHSSGASIVVIGNKIEEDPSFLDAIHIYKQSVIH